MHKVGLVLGANLGFSNIFDAVTPADAYSLGAGLLMLIFDTCCLLLFAIYIDIVRPPEEAPALPPWFFLMVRALLP